MNRLMTRAEIEGARIWYSPEARIWWMDPRNLREAVRIVRLCPDAIHVTNAYEMLDLEFVADLMA